MATVLAFHAHPDDEVFLTGGTLARVAADGHRVVIVVATEAMANTGLESCGSLGSGRLLTWANGWGATVPRFPAPFLPCFRMRSLARWPRG
jgi:LmbE family N-acetylglucosaminyl deacetylase